jgi:chromosome segregation ATPase
VGDFVKEILTQVDQFKDHSHQAAHFKKITEAENKAIEAQHVAEELRIRLAEKEAVFKSMTGQLRDQQGVIESLNLQVTDLKDEMTLATNAQAHDHQHFVESLRAQQTEELARLHERIRELETESASVREESEAHKKKATELELQAFQSAKGLLIRQRPKGSLRRASDPFLGTIKDL